VVPTVKKPLFSVSQNSSHSCCAVLRATIQITRAATGKVEEYEIVGTAAESTEPRTDEGGA
jgi:hypothetical protein